MKSAAPYKRFFLQQRLLNKGDSFRHNGCSPNAVLSQRSAAPDFRIILIFRLLITLGSLNPYGYSLDADLSLWTAASQLMHKNPDPGLVVIPRLPGLAPGRSRAIMGNHYDDMRTDAAADADDRGLFFFHSPLHFFFSFTV